QGSEMAKRAENGMNVITNSTGDMNRLIGEIQKEMDQIGKIVGLIKDIASQTNLLALNAAIEAARAGEAGRGFAVVAAEVKSLAQESRSSAENIAEMIGSLQIKSADAGKSAEITAEAVSGGSAALTETLVTFAELARSVEGISRNIELVASMSEEQAASAEEIAASVQEVSGLLEGTSKEAVEMAGITEETAASLDQLKTIVQNVNSITESVSGAVTRFKV
ncbi:MAG: methyl-accepting chemotaxis protein, partial [Methanospirillum sp.]|uniref:methyl-accepting chemotaxis protein n=1 Tax=Methanospirillum sp. TaxID=45200 RepID=UPI00236D836A